MYKKFLPSILFVCSSVASFAQATLMNFNSSPTIGEKYQIVNSSTIVTPGASGPSATWNFSSLAVASVTYTSTVPCDSTPYCDSFTTTSIAAYTPGSNTLYYNESDTTKLSINGMYLSTSGGNVFINVIGAQTLDQFRYPFTYTSNYIDTVQASLYLQSSGTFYAPTTLTSSINCDAWGTLTLPGGATYNNVLRVHNTQKVTDTAGLGGFGALTIYTINTYTWFDSNYHTALLTIDSATALGGGTTVNVSYLRKTPLAVASVSMVPTDVTVYPNPAQGETSLDFTSINNEQVRISLCDVAGREVAVIANSTFNAGKQHVSFNTASLEKGLYFIRLQSGSQSVTRKIEVL
jgi:Secretion system C-terminal sorting domain